MNKSAALMPFVIALLAVQCTAVAVSNNSDPLSSINSEFLKLYADARNYEISHCGPVIIVSSGKITLIKDNKRTEAKFIPPEYQMLKAVDHTTLAVFVALKRFAGKKLNDATLTHLKLLQQYAPTAEAQLTQLHLDPNTLARQQKILHNTSDFINTVVTKTTVSEEELDNFVRAQTPQLMENANQAVVMELDSLDKQVQSYKHSMTPAQWKQVHVVVCDEHMPRQNEHYMQYFLKQFGETQEGQHVIYQEGNFSESKALQLLGTHILDRSIAKAFFGDPSRMHRDLLSDGAHKYLEQHTTP
jgi:hypothetical protein